MARSQQTRERILECAYDLFYRQGYQATTVDQVIAITGLSKPTVYKHFPSKEVLAVAYLNERKARELGALRERVTACRKPRQRYLAIVDFIRENLPAEDFRGCGFFNMTAEIPDRNSPVTRVSQAFITEIRTLIRDVVGDLKKSDPACKKLDVDRVAESYYILCCGAIMACQELRTIAPANHAMDQIAKLIPPA